MTELRTQKKICLVKKRKKDSPDSHRQEP